MRNFLLALLLLSSSCVALEDKVSGVYMSTCTTNSSNDLKLRLNDDNTFVYELAYISDKVTGTWKMKNDTLKLYSRFFDHDSLIRMNPDVNVEWLPNYQYTDGVKSDIYLVNKKKLLRKTDNGFNKSCFLKKQ